MLDPLKTVDACARLLAEKNLTICFAESATAGALAYAFSLTEDAGTVLKGGIVCYDACIKTDLLSVPPELIEKFSPESAEVTTELAMRLRKVIDADLSVAVTGLTKPGGSESPEKPVGTMFYTVVCNGEVHQMRIRSTGTPEAIVRRTIEQIATTIVHIIRRE